MIGEDPTFLQKRTLDEIDKNPNCGMNDIVLSFENGRPKNVKMLSSLVGQWALDSTFLATILCHFSNI